MTARLVGSQTTAAWARRPAWARGPAGLTARRADDRPRQGCQRRHQGFLEDVLGVLRGNAEARQHLPEPRAQTVQKLVQRLGGPSALLCAL